MATKAVLEELLEAAIKELEEAYEVRLSNSQLLQNMYSAVGRKEVFPEGFELNISTEAIEAIPKEDVWDETNWDVTVKFCGRLVDAKVESVEVGGE